MKNYQKNPIFPSVPFSCMFEQLIPADQVKPIKWHMNNHIWSLNLNLVFKPTSFNLLLVALAQTHSYCHVIACIILLHIVMCWLSSFSVAGVCPLSVDVYRRCDWWHRWRTILSSEVPGKQKPLVHSDTIPLSRFCSLTTLGQQRFNCYFVLR